MRTHHAALAVIAALAIGCGGAAKRAQKAAPSSTDSAAPTNAEPTGPRAQIDDLMAKIRRQSQALEIPTAEPANPCAAGRHPPTGAPVPKASTCADVCRLKDSICSNSEKICTIVEEQLPDDEPAKQKCTDAENACIRAKERCTQCDK